MRELETKIAQSIQAVISESIEVRVGEQLATIPKDQVVVVNLDSKRPKNSAFSDVFENIFKIQVKMHYAESSEEQMEQTCRSIHFQLLNPDLWNLDENILYHQVQDTKKQIQENHWIQEITYMVLSVDKES